MLRAAPMNELPARAIRRKMTFCMFSKTHVCVCVEINFFWFSGARFHCFREKVGKINSLRIFFFKKILLINLRCAVTVAELACAPIDMLTWRRQEGNVVGEE